MIWSYKHGHFDLSSIGIIMGILNVTPDSFSDGGSYRSTNEALIQARQMISNGAKIIDVGGESTRPGSPPVSVHEEEQRVIPVIEALSQEWDGVISIDTSKPEIARAAIEAGARIVNDVTGLQDPEMIFVCRDAGVGVVVMHMQGTPRTMQLNPEYGDVVSEVRAFFEERYDTLTIAGIDAEKLCFDPGIGFGKTLDHNKSLINGLDKLEVQGRPILIGLSRKSFIGTLIGSSEVNQREWPTVALTSYTRVKGARIHRVHSVRDNYDALRMAEILT